MFDAEDARISSALSTRASRRPPVLVPDEDEDEDDAHAAVTNSNIARVARRDGRMENSIEG
jgi:hypothetical protein